MVKHTVEYFDWFDIQKEICKEMGIEEQYFRDYHKLIGGEYKDLWHEWLHYFQIRDVQLRQLYLTIQMVLMYMKQILPDN